MSDRAAEKTRRARRARESQRTGTPGVARPDNRAPAPASPAPPAAASRIHIHAGRLWPSALGVFAFALILRALHLWQLRRAPFFTLLMGDALSYDLWAQRIAAGDWLGRDVFYQAPLYPYMLGVVYRLFGHDLMVARICQALLGSVACALITIAGGRLFGRRAGLVA